jgi:hypothetical protein
MKNLNNRHNQILSNSQSTRKLFLTENKNEKEKAKRDKGTIRTR